MHWWHSSNNNPKQCCLRESRTFLHRLINGSLLIIDVLVSNVLIGSAQVCVRRTIYALREIATKHNLMATLASILSNRSTDRWTDLCPTVQYSCICVTALTNSHDESGLALIFVQFLFDQVEQETRRSRQTRITVKSMLANKVVASCMIIQTNN